MKPAGTFKNFIEMKPIVVIPYDLKAQIMALVNGTNAQECQWYHCIDTVIDEKTQKIEYHLNGMFIPKQEVSGTYVESPGTGFIEIYNELKTTYTDEAGVVNKSAVNEVLGKMHAWCHSHVNMAANPSNTDETTFKEWVQQNETQGITSPVIMMIVNKREEVYLRVYDPQNTIYVEHPDILILMPETDLSYVQHALAEKIKTRTINYPTVIGHASPRVITGPDSGPKVHSASSRTQTPLIPSIVSIGMGLMGGSNVWDKELIHLAEYRNSWEQAFRITKRVFDIFRNDNEVHIFKLLLDGDIRKAQEFLLSPKGTSVNTQEQNLVDIPTLLVEQWAEHPWAFYALVATTHKFINLSGKPEKKIKESTVLYEQFVEITRESLLLEEPVTRSL